MEIGFDEKNYQMNFMCGGNWWILYLFFLFLDLLYRDYVSDHKFTITTFSTTGVVSFFLDMYMIII